MTSARVKHILIGPIGGWSPSRLALWLFLTAVAGSILFYFVGIIVPRVSLLWNYSTLKSLFAEDLGVQSDAIASVLAMLGSFAFAVLWLPSAIIMSRLVWGRANIRTTILGLICFVAIYAYAPLLRAIYGSEVCFNQRTGQPLKWFIIEPGGDIALFDAPGYDAVLGVQRRQATPQICRIRDIQRRGIRPHPIIGDPRLVRFYDEVTSQARVWYAKTPDGQFDLFDGEGTHPTLGEPLSPVTPAIVQEIFRQTAEKQAQADRAAFLLKEKQEADGREKARKELLAAQQAQAEARDQARRELAELFGTASYAKGTVILGGLSTSNDEVSKQAVKQVLNALSDSIRRKGVVVDEFRPGVYTSGHFATLLSGNFAPLSEAGLTSKIRAALVSSIETSCRPASNVTGVYSCTISMSLRRITPDGRSIVSESTQVVGAGSSIAHAIGRAAELLVQRRTDWLEGA